MTNAAFRKLALGMPGALESSHMGHADFRAEGRIFATLTEDEHWAMVKVSPGTQAELMERDPECYVPAKGAWGRAGCTMVRLVGAERGVVKSAVAEA